MRILGCLSIAVAMSLIAVPAYASDTTLTSEPPAGERLLVGRTNIFCVRAPCPWRGIRRQTDATAGPEGLLWSEDRLPQLDASPEDAMALTTAWDGSECLAIDGSLSGQKLRVDRIVGACS
jgi:hypothetical protein